MFQVAAGSRALSWQTCARSQEEREWEEEVQAARRAAAESAEVKRAETLEADISADVAAVVEDEDLPLGGGALCLLIVDPGPHVSCCKK